MTTEFSAVLTGAGPPCLVITGEIDQLTAPALRNALAAASSGRGAVLLDLSAVRYLDSRAIAVLYGFTACSDLEIIVTPGSAVERTLRVCGLHTEARITSVHPQEAGSAPPDPANPDPTDPGPANPRRGRDQRGACQGES